MVASRTIPKMIPLSERGIVRDAEMDALMKAPSKSVKLSTDEAAAALQKLADAHGNKNLIVERLILWCSKQNDDVQRLMLGRLSERFREQVVSEIVWD